MPKLKSAFYSIRKHKCPRCRQGDLFKSPLASLEGVYNMHKSCPSCNQNFEPEPGFYWGAMYVGYGLSSAYMLLGMVVSIFLFGFTINQSFALVIFGGIIIIPILARLARSIWIHIAVRYNKSIAEEIQVD